MFVEFPPTFQKPNGDYVWLDNDGKYFSNEKQKILNAWFKKIESENKEIIVKFPIVSITY